MMIFKKSLPRRAFLRGAGVSLALPFLDAMVPAFASSEAARPPLRLGYIYLPVGRIMENWTPRTQGRDYELPPTLVPFAPFRDQMLVLSGLDIKAADLLPGDRGDGVHARPCSAYLTGVHAYDGSVGISADQVVAKVTGRQTPLASLQLGVDPSEWANERDGAYAGFYRSTISWSTPANALPTENNPRKVFERLFGDTSSLDPETLHRQRQRQGSILDSVNDRVKQLMITVNSGDRYKVEEYLDAVRDIERGIQVAESRSSDDTRVLGDIKRPSGIPENNADHAKLLFDMMHLAYLTDMTRVVAFMLGHEEGNRNYWELGLKEGHHALSHHREDSELIEQLKKIDRYQSELAAYFIEKMMSTKEADGSTLLDNSIIVAGSALSDANNHNHNNIPIAIFGGLQGKLKSGRHIRYDGKPFSNLHLFVLDAFGVSPKEYLSNETSDATGILTDLS